MKKSFVGLLFGGFVLVSNVFSQDLKLDLKKASYLYHFAYDCIDKEYPNKPGEVLGNDSYLAPPRLVHPAFYGCFDWHSSVHGHWALVTILSRFPDFEKKDEIIGKLTKNITKENIQKEATYLNDEFNKDFERTYGWVWHPRMLRAIQSILMPASVSVRHPDSRLTTTTSYHHR